MRTDSSWIKSLFAIFLALIAAGWEIAVRPFLPATFSLSLFLPLLTLFIMGSTRKRGYVATFIGALCLQLNVFDVHDLLFFRWMLVFFLLDVLARRLLTNRSFYVSLALVSFGYILERLTSFLFGTLLWYGGLSSSPWTQDTGLIAGFVWSNILVGVGFLFLAGFTKRFSPSVSRFSRTRLS